MLLRQQISVRRLLVVDVLLSFVVVIASGSHSETLKQPARPDVTLGAVPLNSYEVNITEWERTMAQPSDYRMDTAVLYVKSVVSVTTYYRWQNSECYQCDFNPADPIVPEGNLTKRLQTKYPNRIQIHRLRDDGTNITIFSYNERLTDRGVYWLIIHNHTDNSINGSFGCNFTLSNNPDNPDLPVLYAFIVLLGMAAIWVLLTFLWRRKVFAKLHGRLLRIWSGKVSDDFWEPETKSTANGQAGPSSDNHKTATVKKRLQSLDTLRGLSLTVMIFVNQGGAGYWYFEHAPWNGLTVADLVFPWFIFMMGTSMAFSFRSLVNRNTPAIQVIWKIVWRSVKLFGLGLFLWTKCNATDLHTLRILGVLQRFSLTYLVIALIHYPFARRKVADPKGVVGRMLVDLTPYWLEWLIHLGILAAFLAITYAMPVPGCPTGYVGPGGLHEYGDYYDCVGGAAGYIDRRVFGVAHIFHWPSSQWVYQSTDFDPEGLLGTLSCVFLCFLGLQCGKIVQAYKGNHFHVIGRWLIWGLITGGIALLLTHGSVNEGWVPLNKNLWSVSFILAMASTAFLLLIVMYILIDVIDLWNGAPFIYPGMNSIAVYFLSSAHYQNFPVYWIMPDTQSHWQRLIVNIWSTGFWVFIAFVLYCKKIFIAL